MALVPCLSAACAERCIAAMMRSYRRIPRAATAHGALVVPLSDRSEYQAVRNRTLKVLYHLVKGEPLAGPEAYDQLETRLVWEERLRFEVDHVAVHPAQLNARGVPRRLGKPPANARSSVDVALLYVWRLLWWHSLASLVEAVPVILYLGPGVLDRARVHGRSRGLSQHQFYLCALLLWSRGQLHGWVQPDATGVGWVAAALATATLIGGAAELVGDASLWIGPPPRSPALLIWRLSHAAVFIENPLGMLRYRPFMQGLAPHLQLVDYCMHGMLWMKTTCVWSWGPVGFSWAGRARCKYNCASCLSNGGTHAATIGGDQSHAREAKYVVPAELCAACVASMTGPTGSPQHWVLDLCCGPNTCMEDPTLAAGWSYVGIDHSYDGAPTGHREIRDPRYPGVGYFLVLDLAMHELEAVLMAVQAWTGLLPGDCVGVFWSPPCTTYGRLEYVNRAHRMDNIGTPWADQRGSLARATDAWVGRWAQALWDSTH